MIAKCLKSCMLWLYNIRLLYICTTHLQFLYLSVDVHQADGTKRNDLHGSAQCSEMRSSCLFLGSCDGMGMSIPSVLGRLGVLASCLSITGAAVLYWCFVIIGGYVLNQKYAHSACISEPSTPFLGPASQDIGQFHLDLISGSYV